MAPTFRPGTGSFFWFGNTDASPIIQTVSNEQSAKALDVTAYGNSDENYIPGLRGGTYSADGMYDGTVFSTAASPVTATTKAVDAIFYRALQASTNPIITFGPDGSTIGRRVRMFRAVQTKYMVQSPANDVVKVAVDGQLSDILDAGVVLHPMTAVTATGVYTGVNSGYVAGTTLGGVAHLHLTRATTITTFRVKVQHSTAGVSWADLISFSSSTGTTSAVGAQRTTVAGTVKQYTRATAVALTGGSSKSATFGVAFARRGTRR